MLTDAIVIFAGFDASSVYSLHIMIMIVDTENICMVCIVVSQAMYAHIM